MLRINNNGDCHNSLFSLSSSLLPYSSFLACLLTRQFNTLNKQTNKILNFVMGGKAQTNTVFSANSPMGMEISGRVVVDGEDERGSTGGMRTAETLLRLFPMALCVVALVIMLKNSQTNDFGSLSYSDLGAFKYLVHVNGICAGYSLLSAVAAAIPRSSSMPRAWTFFLLDQILTYVILGAGAVATEVVYLAYKGDSAAMWSQSCGSFGGFCHKATASVAITFAVSLCYIGISLISSYKLFSKYDAPVGFYNNKGIEISAF